MCSTFNDLVEKTSVMDSVRPNDGCSCNAEEGGRHIGDEVLRGGGGVVRCRCWGLCASASRDTEDALLAAIKEEAMLRTRWPPLKCPLTLRRHGWLA